MLLFSKIYEFYCLYGIEILLSGATGADFFPICPNFSHFFPILHIKRSYTVKKIGASLFLTFYHFFPILHIKRSYIYYSPVSIYVSIYISHKTKGCDIWPPLKSQLGKRFLTGSIVLY